MSRQEGLRGSSSFLQDFIPPIIGSRGGSSGSEGHSAQKKPFPKNLGEIDTAHWKKKCSNLSCFMSTIDRIKSNINPTLAMNQQVYPAIARSFHRGSVQGRIRKKKTNQHQSRLMSRFPPCSDQSKRKRKRRGACTQGGSSPAPPPPPPPPPPPAHFFLVCVQFQFHPFSPSDTTPHPTAAIPMRMVSTNSPQVLAGPRRIGS